MVCNGTGPVRDWNPYRSSWDECLECPGTGPQKVNRMIKLVSHMKGQGKEPNYSVELDFLLSEDLQMKYKVNIYGESLLPEVFGCWGRVQDSKYAMKFTPTIQ